LAAWLWFYFHRGDTPLLPRPVGLAVAPFDQAVGMQAARGYEIAGRASSYLRRLPRVASAPIDAAARAWRSADPSLSETERLAWLADTLRARYAVSGRVQASGATLDVRLLAYDSLLRRSIELSVPGDSADLAGLGDRIGFEIARRLVGNPGSEGRALRFTQNAQAAAAFWTGEEASSRGAWRTAEEAYLRALAADSTLVLAKWRLGMARRWSISPETFPPGFYPLDSSARQSFSRTEATLVDAQFARSAAQRFALYRQALDSAPSDPHASLLYGDELFHRGPLAGLPLDSAVVMLTLAVGADPFMAPAWEHLAWARIRLGQRDSAAYALRRLREVSGPPAESWIYLPTLLQAAYAIRFDAPPAQVMARVFDSAGALPRAARGAIGFDLPEYQLQFGAYLAGSPGRSRGDRANGLVAQGVALMALGRPAEALARFDTAALVFPLPAEATLQAAEWRVIPAALGLPGVTAAERQDGRARLAALAADTGVRGGRAAWALAVDAFLAGDTLTGRRWQLATSARADVRTAPLARLLDALAAHARGDSNAIALTSPVLDVDSAGRQVDPFLRSAAHLLRGAWSEAAGAADLADRAWLWYENTDAIGWPDAEAQPVDVDWALGAYAGERRAALALRRGDSRKGCDLARRSLTFWSHPDAGMRGTVDSLRVLAHRCSL
jgi:tetratricopeptide (TPR) repeat protein